MSSLTFEGTQHINKEEIAFDNYVDKSEILI